MEIRLLHHGQKGHWRRRRLQVVAAAGLAVLALSLPMAANATPSEDDIERAKAAENVAQMSVAQIEVELASVSAEADLATQNALIAGEQLNKAMLDLDQAKETTQKAKEQAEKAQADFEDGQRELAVVAQTAYRDGSASLDPLAPYLQSNGITQVAQKQQAITQFGSVADAKMQRVTALQQVATITAKAADEAEKQQAEATEQVQLTTDAANQAAADAQALQESTQARHDVLVQELAERQNTTVELINQRETDLAAQRAAAEQRAAEQRAAAIAAQGQSQSTEASGSTSQQQTSTSAAPSTPSRSQTRSETPAATAPAAPSSSASASGGTAQAIAYAKSKIGVPYVWGGAGPNSFDCSGLVMAAWASAGVSIPHYAASQYSYGTKIPLADRQPGDLIYWSSNGTQNGIYHVAMSLGGNTIIMAPKPGAYVRIQELYNWNKLMPYVIRL